MKMKIGTKLAVSFGVIIGLIMIMAAVSFVALQRTKDDLQKINAAATRLELADNIAGQYKTIVANIRAYTSYGEEKYLQQLTPDFEQLAARENELRSLTEPENKQIVQSLGDDTDKHKNLIANEFIPAARKYNAELAAGNSAGAQVSREQLLAIARRSAPLEQSISQTGDQLAAANAALVKALIQESSGQANRIAIISLVASLLGLGLGIVTAVVLTHKICRPIQQLTNVANQYAAGDLRGSVEIQSHDELGDLTVSLHTMRDHFVKMIGDIRAAAEQLAAASEQLAASTEEVTSTGEEIARYMQNLAGEAESGNSSMLEASKSLVHLSSLIQIAKTKADKTCADSGTTLTAAENGRTKVTESVGKMANITQQTETSGRIIGELNDYSQQIARIIDMITGIANQTNLLALNAAIEAARAGENGRGFAVVAEEVRQLAEQSNQGAQEITALVKKVTEKTQLSVTAMTQNMAEVDQGVATVNQAGSALDKILLAVNQTVAETRAISDVASEEVANSDQIVKLIDHLASVIEAVAAHCEEVNASSQEQSATMQTVAASAEETSAMANQLKESVQRFRV